MYKLNNADIKEWAKNYKGELFDGILCDPPYELGFMGKSWDSTGIAFNVELWTELLRIIKPGGHLLAFSGSRTYHRMAVAIEDAGFEIRDMIEWVYGSGFPKSLNIGKAVDKMGTNPLGWTEFAKTYKQIIEDSNFTHNDIDKHLGIKASSCYWARTDHRGGLPPRHHWEEIKQFIGLDDRYDSLYDEVEREVVGLQEKAMSGWNADGTTKFIDRDITKGTSEWEGYGTALKPAHEPCVLARKPLEGTVANNVLKHGTGGLNIDLCRVPTTEDISGVSSSSSIWSVDGTAKNVKSDGRELGGRFPANLIHDGSDEVEAVFPQTKSTPRTATSGGTGGVGVSTSFQRGSEVGGFNDSGSASRFFYCAKSSRAERNAGLDGTVSIKVQLEICENNITRQENLARLQVVMDNSHLKATAESGTGTKSGTEWSMSLFGNQYTEKYPINIKSTTKTTTNSTTTSVILNWLIGLLTNESTLGVSLEMENGGSPADGVESFSTLTATISDQTALALGVNPALASKRLLISVSDGKNFHSTVKPLSLTKYLATLIKPPTGGRLLVPFSGSGSEIIGALQAGWEYVEGVELTDEYIPIAEARIKHWIKQPVQESLL